MLLKKFFFLLIGLFLLIPQLAFAGDPKPTIQDSAYAAKFVSQSILDPITIEAGSTKEVVLTFKNVGTATWSESTARYISAYTVEPKYRNSPFVGPGWISSKQTGKMIGVVAPGGVGSLPITLKAPETPGTYTERFYLAAENRSWVQGGYFFLTMHVIPKKITTPEVVVDASSAQTNSTAPASLGAYQAQKIGQNKKAIEAQGGSQVSLVLIYQNIGGAAWPGYSIHEVSSSHLANVQGTTLSFADTTWVSQTTVAQSSDTVLAGSPVRKNIHFRVPSKTGTYTATFVLSVDGKPMPGSEASVTVTVTSDAPEHYEPVVLGGEGVVFETPVYRLATEPRIRVGVWKVDKPYIIFESAQDDYDIFTGDTFQGTLPIHTEATITRKNGQYSLVTSAGLSIKSSDYMRLVPKHNPRAVFRIVNYDRKVTWKGPRNFNTYRGAMEYRLTKNGEAVYMINDLLFEDYVAGIGENVDSSPTEYLKAQSVAQRTYAYYVSHHSDKHDERNFDVVATTGDQLYLGYENEVIMPNFVKAVAATRGFMATYDTDKNPSTPNDIVITPYFGNTDGRTRAWTEVWGGGAKPWLVSVKSGYDSGRKLFGHGVGMSQRDAAIRADKEGLDWQTLVKYYYTGVDLETIYK
ncbi:MAG: hypothetical protein KBD15_03435 [Candidatus Magasanikbacteria bacterium]|nr:hypothetical protein [Candidatus Magasanikbacteria bacterium]